MRDLNTYTLHSNDTRLDIALNSRDVAQAVITDHRGPARIYFDVTAAIDIADAVLTVGGHDTDDDVNDAGAVLDDFVARQVRDGNLAPGQDPDPQVWVTIALAALRRAQGDRITLDPGTFGTAYTHDEPQRPRRGYVNGDGIFQIIDDAGNPHITLTAAQIATFTPGT